MIVSVLLSFLAGIVTVIFLELHALDALLQPFRDVMAALFPGG